MNSTSTLNRFPAHTDDEVNCRIRKETEQRLAYYEATGTKFRRVWRS
jgi:hypothetical protein